jgi:hypothetical protein
MLNRPLRQPTPGEPHTFRQQRQTCVPSCPHTVPPSHKNATPATKRNVTPALPKTPPPRSRQRAHFPWHCHPVIALTAACSQTSSPRQGLAHRRVNPSELHLATTPFSPRRHNWRAETALPLVCAGSGRGEMWSRPKRRLRPLLVSGVCTWLAIRRCGDKHLPWRAMPTLIVHCIFIRPVARQHVRIACVSPPHCDSPGRLQSSSRGTPSRYPPTYLNRQGSPSDGGSPRRQKSTRFGVP